MTIILIILVIIFVLLFIFVQPFRLIVFNPFKTIYYACIDIFYYFYHLEFNKFRAGSFNAYDSYSSLVFGSGKTLSLVNQVLKDYEFYNNKKVFDIKSRKFVTQKVHVLSNISFTTIPYEKLVNLSKCPEYLHKTSS